MQVANIVIAKTDEEYNTFCVNQVNTASEDPDVNTVIDYGTLTVEQKAVVDAFEVLALSFVPE